MMKFLEVLSPGHAETPAPAGLGSCPAPHPEFGIQRRQRREWWLWLSALGVTLLATLVFLLSALPSLFAYDDAYFAIRADQAAWGTMALLLLFNAWMVYRQWFFRHEAEHAGEFRGDQRGYGQNLDDPSALDPVTGFYTLACLEHRLARETAYARRQNTPLSLVAIHLEDFPQIVERFGKPAGDQMLKEFARRLRKSTRGSDFGACLGDDNFLVVLPECSLAAAKLLSNRLGPLEMKCAGQDVILTYSAGWIDYQAGESPAELISRAQRVLQLYKEVTKDSLATMLTAG